MHKLSSAFVLGYHGCDTSIAEQVLAGDSFLPSTNDYDWLGHGVYFWEANPLRGLEFARELSRRARGPSKISTPYVVGAVIDLGLCLDLTTKAGIDRVKLAYAAYSEIIEQSDNRRMPRNHFDGLRRNLDCAVINTLHQIMAGAGQTPFDTVKGVFVEGGAAYPGGGIMEKTHIQICVRNPESIKAVFRVTRGTLSV